MNSIFFITLVVMLSFLCMSSYAYVHTHTCIHTTHEGPFSGISKFSFVFNTQLLSRLVKLDAWWHFARFMDTNIYNANSPIQSYLERNKHRLPLPCHFLSASGMSDWCMCSSVALSEGTAGLESFLSTWYPGGVDIFIVTLVRSTWCFLQLPVQMNCRCA